MELTEKPRERYAPGERCPYCHDELTHTQLELIVCPRCRTQHHQTCIHELGRCSVFGCEEPLSAPGDLDPVRFESPAVRAIRRRIRERVRRFVRDHSRPSEDPRRLLREALARRKAADALGDTDSRREASDEVHRLLAMLTPAEGTAILAEHRLQGQEGDQPEASHDEEGVGVFVPAVVVERGVEERPPRSPLSFRRKVSILVTLAHLALAGGLILWHSLR